MTGMSGQVASGAREDSHLERFDPSGQAGKLIDAEHRARYWWAAQIAPGGDVLDAGCGTGYGSSILKQAGAASVTAVDVSAEALSATANHLGDDDAVVEADLRDIPLEDDSFDLAVCWEAIEHIDEGERAVAELRRVLRPDGVLLVSSPNPDVYPSGNEHHVHEYRATELAATVGERFANVAVYRQHAWLASAIESRKGAGAAQAQGNGAESRSVRVTEDLQSGGETYALIVASDGVLPELSDLVTFGSAFEVRWWQEELAEMKKFVAQLEAREAEALTRLHEANGALLEANQSLAQVPVLSGQVEEMRASIQGIENSISWRLTSPIRRLRRLARR
jgi:ubiquinone/menaquinone biosynthesis C-methylase UbiE